jgi:hypothetical protein
VLMVRFTHTTYWGSTTELSQPDVLPAVNYRRW